MNNQTTKKPTGPNADDLHAHLFQLSCRMHVVAYRIEYFGGMDAKQQMRARELSRAADMVYRFSCEMKKEVKK
jgi:hypothetical protein